METVWVTGGAVALHIDIEDRAADLEPRGSSHRLAKSKDFICSNIQ